MRPLPLARHLSLLFAIVGGSAAPPVMRGQAAPGLPGDAPSGILPGVKVGGSSNMHLVAHIPVGGFARVSNVEVEQERSRPYAYAAQMLDRTGFAIFDLHDLANVRLIYRWTIENVSLHQPILGGVDGKYFDHGRESAQPAPRKPAA